MSAKEIKALGRHLTEEWNKGKAAAIAAIDKFYAPDFIYHSGGGQEIRGLKDYKKSFSEIYTAFPDVHFTLDDMVVEGDKVVWRGTMTGTHKGELMGIPPTNKKMTIWLITINRFAGGKIVEDNGIFDALGLMRQLGLVPTPKKEK